jgi:hypothetical protein
MSKTFTVTMTRERTGTETLFVGTISELVEKFAYTLECGAGYSHEKGNAKINRRPATIVSLIKNLNNAVTNSAANGYASHTYS